MAPGYLDMWYAHDYERFTPEVVSSLEYPILNY
jgi:hypothetical protein